MAEGFELSIPDLGLQRLDRYEEDVQEAAGELGGALERVRKHSWELEEPVPVEAQDDSSLYQELRELKSFIDPAQDSMRSFKRTWREFDGAVKDAFDAELEPYEERLEEVRAERKRRLDAFKAGRREMLEEEYDSYSPFIASQIPFDLVLDGSWSARGIADEEAVDRLHARCRAIAADIDELQSMGLEYESEALGEYFRTLDRQAAYGLNDRLVAGREAAEEMAGEQAEVEERKIWRIRAKGTEHQAEMTVAAAERRGMTYVELEEMEE